MNHSLSDKWLKMQRLVGQRDLSHISLVKTIILRRLFAENILVFLLQWAGLTLTTLTPHTLPMWFASGVAFGFIMMRGHYILPGIFFGSLLAYFFKGAAFFLALKCAILWTGQTYLLLWLTYRFCGPSLLFTKKHVFYYFIGLSLLVTGIMSFLLTLSCYTYFNPHSFFTLWCEWWLANFNGLCIFSLAITTWDYYFSAWELLKQLNKIKLILSTSVLFVLLISCIVLMTFIKALFVIFTMGWIRKQWDFCGAVLALFITGLFFSVAALLGVQTLMSDYAVLLTEMALFFSVIVGLRASKI